MCTICDPCVVYTSESEESYRLQSVFTLFSGSGVPRNFVPGGVQQIQLRTEDIENGDLGAVAS